MKTHDFYYALPPELIAQTPIQRRDASRLMTLNKETGELGHYHFYDLPQFLKPRGRAWSSTTLGFCPPRLLGQREPSSAETCEGGCSSSTGESNVLGVSGAAPGKKLRTGAKLSFGHGALQAEIIEVLENGNRLIRFFYEGIFLEILERLGKMPLPPYIKAELQDGERTRPSTPKR